MNIVITAKLLCLVFAVGPPDFWLTSQRKELVCKQASLIIKESKKNDLDPTLLSALITVESNWKRTVVSRANACGLTQVIPKYTGRITRKYTCDELKNPKNSIQAGAKILKWWINHHNGSIVRGLCGYNAGFRCKGKKPTRHGMRYARKILKLQSRIQELAIQEAASL